MLASRYYKPSGLKQKCMCLQSWSAAEFSLAWAKIRAKLNSFLEALGENLFPYLFQFQEATLGCGSFLHVRSQECCIFWGLSSSD